MKDLDGKRCFLRWDAIVATFVLMLEDAPSEWIVGANPRRLSEDALHDGASEVRWSGEACQIAFVLGLL